MHGVCVCVFVCVFLCVCVCVCVCVHRFALKCVGSGVPVDLIRMGRRVLSWRGLFDPVPLMLLVASVTGCVLANWAFVSLCSSRTPLHVFIFIRS